MRFLGKEQNRDDYSSGRIAGISFQSALFAKGGQEINTEVETLDALHGWYPVILIVVVANIIRDSRKTIVLFS